MTNSTGPIMVAVADKQHSALAYAIAEGNRSSREVRVIHAYEVLPAALSLIGETGVIAGYEAGGQDVLNAAHDYVEALEPRTLVRYELFRGRTVDVLTRESHRASELIIGPDDSPWLIRLFQGTVTRRLVEGASCPVVVVPSAWVPDLGDQEIVVCIDAETPAHGPLDYAFSVAAVRKTSLRVVYVEPIGTGSSASGIPRDDFLLEAWGEMYPEVNFETSVIEGDAISISLDLTRSVGLVIAGRPHTGRTSILQRSFAERLVESAGCPVVIVPSVDHKTEF